MSAVGDAVKAYADRVDAAANDISGDIDALKAQLAAAATVEEVSSILQPVTEKLEALGASNPPIA